LSPSTYAFLIKELQIRKTIDFLNKLLLAHDFVKEPFLDWRNT